MFSSKSRAFRIHLQFLDVRKVVWIAQKVDERVSNIQKLVLRSVSMIIIPFVIPSHMLLMQFKISGSLRSVSFVLRI